jgi:uncharacterized protein YutE (UPF0331/DUF86 family)
MNDIIINKIQSIQRCIQRAREEYSENPDNFETDYTRQDASILNIIRACEQSIDLANHIIKTQKMGIPCTSGESFELLHKANVISFALSEKLKKMVAFRNTVIHDYRTIDLQIVISVIKTNLDDLNEFTQVIFDYSRKE